LAASAGELQGLNASLGIRVVFRRVAADNSLDSDHRVEAVAAMRI
jgi:hypothetical protein